LIKNIGEYIEMNKKLNIVCDLVVLNVYMYDVYGGGYLNE